MKRLKILCVLFIVLLSTSIIVLICKNNKKYIMYDGMMLAMTLDGNKIVEVPDGMNYRVEVDCGDTAIGKWLPEEWRLSVEDIKGNVECDIDFYTLTDNDKLSNVLKGKVGEVKYFEENSTAIYNSLQEEEYKVSTYSSSSGGATSGSSTSAFQFLNGKWSTDVNSMVTRKYYYFKFTPSEPANYQVCYSLPERGSYSSYNTYNFSINDQDVTFSIYLPSSGVVEDECINLYGLTTSDSIGFRQYTTSGSIAPISFYIKKTNDIEEISLGYRYSGKNPNNYVWFNNEMWRIIGLVPACTESSNGKCSTTTDLIKIIRDEVIGDIAYDAKSSSYTAVWGNNTLYKLLNQYYLSKQNGTNSGYCYSYALTSNSKCDYRKIGISSDNNDYYGKMVENVYWNTGTITTRYLPKMIYIQEKSTTTSASSKIGLINASDYGLGVSSTYYNKKTLYTYNKDEDNVNWLYFPDEWLIGANYLKAEPTSTFSSFTANYGNGVRPVVYLNPDVYKISGTGSILDPYIIGM